MKATYIKTAVMGVPCYKGAVKTETLTFIVPIARGNKKDAICDAIEERHYLKLLNKGSD